MSNRVKRREAAQLRRRQIRSKAAGLDPAPAEPCFVADVMLGRLAKWLAIAGFDVRYSNRITDDELIAVSREEGRILLSRDTRLLVRRDVTRFIFLESENLKEQIRQVFRATETRALPSLLSRCIACNLPLADAAREIVKERVPPFVYATQKRFQVCPGCRRVFWAGTHRQAVVRMLENLLENPSHPA